MDKKPVDLWLGLGGLALGILLYLLPPKTPVIVVLCLAAMVGLLIHPIWNFPWIEKRLWRRVSLLIVVIFIIGLVGVAAWPPSEQSISERRNALTDPSQQQTSEIRKLEGSLPTSSPTIAVALSPSPSEQSIVKTRPVVIDGSQDPRRPETPDDVQKPRIEQRRAQIENISVSEREFESGDQDVRYGLEVTISTTVPIHPVHMVLYCSGPISSATLRFKPLLDSGVIVSNNLSGLDYFLVQDSYEFSFNDPPLTPRTPLQVRLFSRSKIHVEELKLK